MSFAVSLIGLIIVIILLAVLITTMFRSPRPADAWRIAGTPVISPPAQSYYLGCIRRHTNFRRIGAIAMGLLALISTLLAGASVTPWGNTGTICTANVCGDQATRVSQALGTSMAIALVPACVLGAILGGLLAETYRLRQPTGVRLASLDAREPRSLPRRAYVAWSMTALTLAAGIAVWVTESTPALLVALVPGLLAVLLAEAIQFALTYRRRPVLIEDAMNADRNMRRAVSESVTWVELGAATLNLGWAAMAVGNLIQALSLQNWTQAFAIIFIIGGFFSVIPALIYVHRSSLVKPPGKQTTELAKTSKDYLPITRWFMPPARTTS